MNDTLRNQYQRHHERHRQQDVERAAGQIDPEIAQIARVAAGKTANEGHQHGHAGGGGDKVLHRQAEHLGQVAHGGLAAVALPVGIGNEADGGVQGRIRRYRTHTRRVERQQALESLQQVQEDKPDQREQEHGDCVGFPIHLILRMDASQTVRQPFQRSDHGR